MCAILDNGRLSECHSAVSPVDSGGTPEPVVRPGQRFTTVLLGMPLGDRLSLFHDDGTITTHRVAPDADLVNRIGRGSIARSDVGEGFRGEAALWDQSSATLLVTSRFGGKDSVAADGFVLSASLPPDEERAEPDLRGLHTFLTEVAKASAAAGEAVYLSRGGWSGPPNDQYVLFVATRSANGEPISHIETFPHPGPSSIWDLFEDREPGKAVVVRSPLEAGMDGVGPLLFAAASHFGPANELALSYIESRL